MGTSFDSEYLDHPLIAGRVWDAFMPDSAPESAAFFFIHGGGWKSGSRAQFHPMMQVLAGRGYPCATTDYRLGGVHVADQLADVRHSYSRFVLRLRELKQPPRVVVFGSSAGAHLALLLSLAPPGACGDALPTDPAAGVRPVGVAVQAAPVTFEPWTDIFPKIWQSMQAAAGAPYRQQPDLYTRLSPIAHIDKTSPPVFLMQAQYEHMFPPHLAEAFAEKMRAMGRPVQLKTYPGTEHGFFYDLSRRQQREALEDIVHFAQRLTKQAEARTRVEA